MPSIKYRACLHKAPSLVKGADSKQVRKENDERQIIILKEIEAERARTRTATKQG